MRQALAGRSARPQPRFNRGPMVMPTPPDSTRSASLPAPTGGWDAISPLGNMKPDRAIVLDNWFPRPDSIEVRKGIANHCTGLTGATVVDSLMAYHAVNAVDNKLFAATSGRIWDVSSAAAPVVTTETGLSNNRWQHVNFTTSAGKFLFICNGVDAARHWNGSVWTQPVITGISSTDIVHVNAHKNRLWFTQTSSTQAAFLATGAVAGAVTTFELGGFFTKGGYLNAMATWSVDTGSGPDDVAVFISSRGQAVIFRGTDPTSISTWAIVGVYDLGAPLGRRCFTKIASDVALINIDGVLPISRALQTDRGAVAGIALTRNIQNIMTDSARSYSANFGWQLQPYPRGTMALLNVPVSQGVTQHQYVVNTLTGAWCRFTGWNVNCMEVFNDKLYLGGNSGQVYLGDSGAIDVSTAIDAIGQGAWNYYGTRGQLKNFGLLRALVTTDSNTRLAVGLATDFRDNASLGTPSTVTQASAVYDTAVWDTDVYATEGRAVDDWASVANQGHCASVEFRGRTSSASSAILRLNSFDVIYRLGGLM